MDPRNQAFLQAAEEAAEKCSHPFPLMAAAEAGLESGHPDPVTKYTIYGQSELARVANNLFGMKQHCHPIYGTLNLPTHEGTPGHPDWREITAAWVKYPDWASCFADRLATLQRLSNVYPHYKAALAATDAVTYATEVSKTWSSDQTRGAKVIAIYDAFRAIEDQPA